jgi:hypothetical protein
MLVIRTDKITPVGQRPERDEREQRRFWDCVTIGLAAYCVTSAMVMAGASFGIDFVMASAEHPDSAIRPDTLSGRFGAWDGVWYRRIATEGYQYTPEQMSSVAFYPLYPLAAWAVTEATGLHIEHSLLLISHLCLAGCFVLLAIYMSAQRQEMNKGEGDDLRSSAQLWTSRMDLDGQDFALLAFGLFPTSFYFRMSYTESMFLLVSLFAMYAMQKRWPAPAIAVIIGLATAARPVGLALVLPFVWYIWRRSRTVWASIGWCFVLLPLSAWGISAYMVYQWHSFGDPLAFVNTQIHWYERMPPVGWWQKVFAHVSLEPLWSVYDAGCTCFWANDPPRQSPVFSLQFMNPLFVAFTWGAIAWGAIRRYLTVEELLLSIGLLGIPYFTHAYRSCMASEARYAAIVFPLYIVLGHALSYAPRTIASVLCAASAVCVALYAAMFVSWYWFY